MTQSTATETLVVLANQQSTAKLADLIAKQGNAHPITYYRQTQGKKWKAGEAPLKTNNRPQTTHEWIAECSEAIADFAVADFSPHCWHYKNDTRLTDAGYSWRMIHQHAHKAHNVILAGEPIPTQELGL